MVYTLASADKGAHIDKTTTYFFVEFLVVRVPTSSPTAADTHNSSEQIGQNWANATLLHIVNFVQAPELHRLRSLARAPSHQGLLQPCRTLAVQCPMLPACLNAAPMRRKLELRLFLSSLTTLYMRVKGCRISFRSSDSWINTLEYYIGFKPRETRIVPLGASLHLSSSRHSDKLCRVA